MFNWFKSKVELKKDNSIMSSYHNKKGLKLDSEIVVPNNFELLVFHKGKHYTTLASGKYKMEQDTFPNLISAQIKKKHKVKYIKCVCHYVNISNQTLEIKFKKQMYTVEFKIDNALDFCDLLLLYAYKVDNDYVVDTLNDVFCELLLHLKGDYKQVTSSSLSKYGITINSFAPKSGKVSIFSTNKQSIIEPQVEQSTTSKDQTTNTTLDTNIVTQTKEPPASESQNNKFPACPKCNHIAKFNTTYCLRCGYKLDE